MPGSAFSIRNILLFTISILTLLIVLLVGWKVSLQWQQLAKIQQLKEATILGDQLFETGESLSVERHVSFSMLHALDTPTIDNFKPQLEDSRQKSDAALKTILMRMQDYNFPGLQPRIRDMEIQMGVLKTLRAEIDAAVSLPMEQRDRKVSERWFKETTDMILKTEDLWMAFMKNFIGVDPIVNLQMQLKYFLGSAAEHAGRERSIIGRFIVEDVKITPQEQVQLLRWKSVADFCWRTVHILADQSRLGAVLAPYIKDAESDAVNIYGMVRDPFYVVGVPQRGPYPISGEIWLELTKQANDSLHALKSASLKETRNYVDVLEMEAQQSIVVHSLILLFTLILCVYSFYVLIFRVLRPINTMIEALVRAAQGRTISPVSMPVKQEDEIGKLAQVLSVFQQKAEELKRSSIVMQRYIDELKRSNQELDDFAYIASHDLKEPLRGLSHQAAFLLEDCKDKLDAESVQRLYRLESLSQRMEHLIGDLLYYSRLGRTDLAVQEVDPNEIVNEILLMMDSFVKERHAKVTITHPMPRVVCDKLKIAEVFRNLIINAIKYNDKSVPAVEVGHMENVKAPHGEEKLVFYVRDNGVGIEPEFHRVIFRIFKRLKNPAVQDEEGTGAGLTFVKKIIERHRGRIWLESTPGKGSVFYFTLQGKDI